MLAITYQGLRGIQVKKMPIPQLKNEDDVIIKVTKTAICGSDLHIYHHMIPHIENTIIGHEAVGIVEEVGPRVTKVKPGDRVLIPFPVACGGCQYCVSNYYASCDLANPDHTAGGFYGFGQNFGSYNGAQAEYMRIPFGNTNPYLIPDDISDREALLATDVLPTAYWGVESAAIKPDDTVVVLGCGPVGLLTQALAWLKGAKRVIAVDHVDYRLEHAKRHYQVETMNLNQYEDAGEAIFERTKGGTDVVIDCVGMGGIMHLIDWIQPVVKRQGGSKSAIEIAASALRKNGRYVLLGLYGACYNQFPFGDFFNKGITMKMGLCPAHQYVEPLFELIRQDKFYPTNIITHEFPLSKGKSAYKLFANKRDECIKVVLIP